MIKFFPEFFIRETSRAAFNAVKNFRRMETETRYVAEPGNIFALVFFSESVRRIVNYFQIVFFRDTGNFFDVANISVDVNRHYRSGFFGNQVFYFRNVNREVFRIYVAKNRCQIVSDNRMGCRGKGKRSGDNFRAGRKFKRLQRQFDRHVTVHEEFDIFRAKKFEQLRLKNIVVLAHIGKPTTLPNIFQKFAVLFKVRH